MRLVRRHLTYANVAATLALFLALGGAAYAATRLPRNSVGNAQLRKSAVTASKIAKKTRRQLRGDRGPTGPQGKTGKTGARGPQGKTGATGAAGSGPAYEVFGTSKSIAAGGGTVIAENLAQGAYVISADVAIEATAATEVTCTLNGGGEAVGHVESGVPTTLTLSVTRNLGGAGNATLSCAAPAGATAKYANIIATQVKSQSRVAG
ncbi:MAG: hypothetical protein QM729_17935 [Solirubrobacterales bacterium]